METKLAKLDEQLLNKNSETEMRNRMLEMEEEQKQMKLELESKTHQILEINKKADEYLKKREQAKSIEIEKKMSELNKKHENTIELLKQREAELIAELNEKTRIIDENQSESMKQEDQTQTDFCYESETTANEQQDKNDDLDTRLMHLQIENNQKDNLIKQLQEEIAQHKKSSQEENDEQIEPASQHQDKQEKETLQGKVRNDRSQSLVANSEHAVMCQKAASRFHNLVTQITEKRDKNYKSNEAARSKLNREKSTKDYLDVTPKSLGCSSWSNKSPNCLSPLRESSPFKLRLDGQEAGSPTHRSLLSPSDIGEDSSRRSSRVSPSRFFFAKNAYDKSKKNQPAWKF
uniref:Uncharacterized protein n=1 Tax=Ditylenchus dipsaci TaxID=166011 RepID=A0A915D4T8_9BILA